jgi:hypothetical protein
MITDPKRAIRRREMSVLAQRHDAACVNTQTKRCPRVTGRFDLNHDLAQHVSLVPPPARALTREERNSSRSSSARDGHRFESPPLHQVVPANRPGFPAPTIPRLFSALARTLMVCGVYSAGTTGPWPANAEMSLRRRILGSRLGGCTDQRDREPFGFIISVGGRP